MPEDDRFSRRVACGFKALYRRIKAGTEPVDLVLSALKGVVFHLRRACPMPHLKELVSLVENNVKVSQAAQTDLFNFSVDVRQNFLVELLEFQSRHAELPSTLLLREAAELSFERFCDGPVFTGVEDVVFEELGNLLLEHCVLAPGRQGFIEACDRTETEQQAVDDQLKQLCAPHFNKVFLQVISNERGVPIRQPRVPRARSTIEQQLHEPLEIESGG